jgi:hypothetical protein
MQNVFIPFPIFIGNFGGSQFAFFDEKSLIYSLSRTLLLSGRILFFSSQVEPDPLDHAELEGFLHQTPV